MPTAHPTSARETHRGVAPTRSRHAPVGHQQSHFAEHGHVFWSRFSLCAFGLPLWWFHKKVAGSVGCWVHLLLDWRHLSSPQTYSDGSAARSLEATFSHPSSHLGINEKEVFVSPSFQVKSLCLDSSSKVLRPFVSKKDQLWNSKLHFTSSEIQGLSVFFWAIWTAFPVNCLYP